MHDIKWIRENAKAFDAALGRRDLSDEDQKRFSSSQLISIDDLRRAQIRVLETWQAKRNAASKEIGAAKKRGDEAAAQKLMAEVAEAKDSIETLEGEEKATSKKLNDVLAQIPNLPLDEVPDGNDAEGNIQHHHFGAKRTYAFSPKQHFDLGEALGQMDFETAAKLSGARFVVLKNGLARLERALGQFMLDVHTGEHGYTEVNPPLLVRDNIMFGTAQLPKFRDDQFEALTEFFIEEMLSEYDQYREAHPDDTGEETAATITKLKPGEPGQSIIFRGSADWFREYSRRIDEAGRERRWLIPTAEVPLTNLVRESILDEAELPLRLTALTPCFRAEAGAAGKDTRGMIRQHQFTKVELVSITTPEQSKDEHERMLSCAEEVLRRLDLHYRVMTLCAGDMGFPSQKTYDIEVWLPGQNMYREISSCSICGEFQARRMSARYRTKEGRTVRHVHTLNGSGVAVGRALIAVMENYQEADGSIVVPDALAPYMGGLKKIEHRA
jgi:seryl-tRNA synthetase